MPSIINYKRDAKYALTIIPCHGKIMTNLAATGPYFLWRYTPFNATEFNGTDRFTAGQNLDH